MTRDETWFVLSCGAVAWDCIHSYGTLARSRSDAETVIAELTRYGCELEVWVDHSKAPSNFGTDVICWPRRRARFQGLPCRSTRSYGIRYVWRGRTTGIVGQDRPIDTRSLTAIFRFAHPLRSAQAIAESSESSRSPSALDRTPGGSYATNRVCQPAHLRDGLRVWEFLRIESALGGPGLRRHG